MLRPIRTKSCVAAERPTQPSRRRQPLTWPARLAARGSIIAGLLAAGLLLGTIAEGATSTDVPAGTTVLGVEIGGRDRSAAEAALRAGISQRLAAPVILTLGQATTTVDPAQAGLSLDTWATVDRAAANWPDPLRVLSGGRRAVEPVVRVDAHRLEAVLADRIENARRFRPAAVTFDGLTPRARYATAGQVPDITAAVAAFRAGWLRRDRIAAPLRRQDPRTSPADVDRMLAEVARPAVAAPVGVVTPAGQLTIGRDAIARSLVIAADDAGRLVPRVDEARLRAAAAAELARVEVEPHLATVPTADGRDRTVASTGGRRVDTARLSRDLLVVLGEPAPRRVAAGLTTAVVATIAPDLARLGIREPVSSFTTYFDAGQARNKNITQVAREVDGALVGPGRVFSLNGHTGPRGYGEGYVDAPVLIDGKLVSAAGGGVSQFTTTLFNAMYYAGLADVAHRPHSYYFARYPPVIESTIFYPSLDMKFRNDSTSSVLIDTSYTDHSVTVTIWGTRRFQVSTEWGPRRAVTQPGTVHLPGEPGCIATRGIEGFTQDAWRIFRRGGVEVRRERFSHTYQPEPRFFCDQ